MTRVHVDQIQKAPQREKALQILIQQILEGPHGDFRSLPMMLRPFWQLKGD